MYGNQKMQKLVISHDDNLKKVFGKDLPVNKTSLAELKQATINRIPTLDEALLFIDRKVDKILVELKEVGHEKMVLDVIRKAKSARQGHRRLLHRRGPCSSEKARQ